MTKIDSQNCDNVHTYHPAPYIVFSKGFTKIIIRKTYQKNIRALTHTKNMENRLILVIFSLIAKNGL